MNRRVIAGSLLAAFTGLLALIAALAGTASATQLIDPFSRITSFLSLAPRHPVQLAVATTAIYLVVGVCGGIALHRLSRVFDIPAAWPLSAFAAALVGSLAIASVLHKASPPVLASSLLPHVTILLLAAAMVAAMTRRVGVRAS